MEVSSASHCLYVSLMKLKRENFWNSSPDRPCEYYEREKVAEADKERLRRGEGIPVILSTIPAGSLNSPTRGDRRVKNSSYFLI